MKIKSPLTNKKEVKPLCASGADELFCGIEPYKWRKKYRNFRINQRSTGANFTKLSDLETAIQTAHRFGVRVHVAVNGFFYLEEQYRALREIIRDICKIGADGLIFAEPTLILNTKESLLKAKDVVIGCDAVILNSAAVELYQKLGATRVVLPRAMTIPEIEELVKKTEHFMEHEAFIINDLCFFIDGFCTYCKEGTGRIKKEGRRKGKVYFFRASSTPHRGFGEGCRTRFRKQRMSLTDNKQIGKIIPFEFWMKKRIDGCGACAIYDLKRMRVTSLKILDRRFPTEEKVRATEFIKKCLEFLKNGDISKTDYITRCQGLFKKTFKAKCNRFDCYYPSVFMTGDKG